MNKINQLYADYIRNTQSRFKEILPDLEIMFDKMLASFNESLGTAWVSTNKVSLDIEHAPFIRWVVEEEGAPKEKEYRTEIMLHLDDSEEALRISLDLSSDLPMLGFRLNSPEVVSMVSKYADGKIKTFTGGLIPPGSDRCQELDKRIHVIEGPLTQSFYEAVAGTFKSLPEEFEVISEFFKGNVSLLNEWEREWDDYEDEYGSPYVSYNVGEDLYIETPTSKREIYFRKEDEKLYMSVTFPGGGSSWAAGDIIDELKNLDGDKTDGIVCHYYYGKRTSKINE
ncbi:hypothetical protein [Paenibacillus dendritiformis]|uniref:hypothetical protein n=1 Tax=Paenibacillus dendritiformis TaxID=130049 RepID=UPI000DA758BE|nr:hypothetical protein [Paenibacillus dendritiformis]PZM63728.1 hypothetical protein DOE73_20595 [Paenibacillus dendritiformis]